MADVPVWAHVADHPCITAFCIRCRRGLGSQDDEEGLHFDTVGQAREAAASEDWLTVGDTLLCPRCAEAAACDITGHTWSHLPGVPASPGSPATTEWWVCDLCGTGAREDPTGTPPLA